MDRWGAARGIVLCACLVTCVACKSQGGGGSGGAPGGKGQGSAQGAGGAKKDSGGAARGGSGSSPSQRMRDAVARAAGDVRRAQAPGAAVPGRPEGAPGPSSRPPAEIAETPERGFRARGRAVDASGSSLLSQIERYRRLGGEP